MFDESLDLWYDAAEDGPEVDILRAAYHGYIPSKDAEELLTAISLCRRYRRG
jgi:hypothetical protein